MKTTATRAIIVILKNFKNLSQKIEKKLEKY